MTPASNATTHANALSFLDGQAQLHAGDCVDVLRTLPDASVDSCVTDPPYALVSITRRFGKDGAAPCHVPEGRSGAYARASAGFMGKAWDTGERAFSVELWAEVLRVLKPGGHVVAFGGTRTVHRLACAIEDAGFEIRDSLFWHFGSGFPKSHNISRKLDETKERCSCPAHLRSVRNSVAPDIQVSGDAQQDVRADMRGQADSKCSDGAAVSIQSADHGRVRGLRNTKGDAESVASKGFEADVLAPLQRSSSRGGVGKARSQGSGCADAGELRQGCDEGTEEPGLEGRGHLSKAARELCDRPVCEVSARADRHGESGRLRDGAPASDGEADRPAASAGRVRPSSRPRSTEQRSGKSGALAGQPKPQERRAWPHCERCGKPIVPDGLGTALKPATEIIVLARKPLSEGTVAANVLAHGTGAINIDGCRVGMMTPEEIARSGTSTKAEGWGMQPKSWKDSGREPQGRWPANIVHDGSDEVVAAFPASAGQHGDVRGTEKSQPFGGHVYGEMAGRHAAAKRGDAGSAARFFYSAKAGADDRLGSKHPTVKPVDLMQWLVRLVTPPGGTVLDPFAGTGTTGEAAFREGFKAVLIEREAEYQADIARRMSLVLAGPDERAHAIIKARGTAAGAGPLFGDAA